MRNRVLTAVLFLLANSFCVPAWGGASQLLKAPASEEFASDAERIGGLRLGMPEEETAGLIPCKPLKNKEIFEGATGRYVQTWKYPEFGVALKMGSERKGGAKTIESITIKGSCNLATSRGIRIGSTEEEVADAYGRYRDRENTVKGKTFTAGSIYDGMIFRFKKGKVTEIFLGAAAE